MAAAFMQLFITERLRSSISRFCVAAENEHGQYAQTDGQTGNVRQTDAVTLQTNTYNKCNVMLNKTLSHL